MHQIETFTMNYNYTRAINAVTLGDIIGLPIPPCIQATTYFCYSKMICIVWRDAKAVTKLTGRVT